MVPDDTVTRDLGGRPREWADEDFVPILARHAQGELLLNILKDHGMPSWGTFWTRVRGPDAPEWLKKADDVARQSFASHKSEELMIITDEDPIVAFQNLDAGGKDDKEVVRVDGAAVQWQKLRVETRKWLVSKVLPRLYGERVAATLQNPDGSAVIPTLTLIVKKE